MAANHQTRDYSISVDFEKGTESPSRIYRTMTGLIESFQEIDKTLCHSIDLTIKPVLLLEDIEAGSIKTWLRPNFEIIPDDALKKLDWRQIIGIFLVRAKHKIIGFTNDKTEITDIRQLEDLRDDLHQLAEETDVRQIPVYQPIQIQDIVGGLRDLVQALEPLHIKDRAKMGTSEGEVGFNNQFNVSPEQIEDLLTQEIIPTEEKMILKVKKPDYLGNSMWDFRYGARTISAKISDNKWLENFQKRAFDVRPGDAIRARVQKKTHYDHEREVIEEHYDITSIESILHQPRVEQIDLTDIIFSDDDE